MPKTHLVLLYLIVIVLLILIIAFALIKIYPNDGLISQVIVRWVAARLPGIRFEPGENFSKSLVNLFSLLDEKVIGYFGRAGHILDSSFGFLNSTINQYKVDIREFGHLVFLRWQLGAGYVYQSKKVLGSILYEFLSSADASLLFGMVFGGAQNIDSELRSGFKVTGMLHVLSASGYNVGLIKGISTSLCRRFWRIRTASILSIGIILIYVYLADLTPSVIRAGLMIILQICAVSYFHRQVNIVWLLGFSACLMIFANDSYLESLSFQFSMLACFGILVWSSVFKHQALYTLSSGEASQFNITQVIKDSFWLTVAAQSFSWGIQIAAFGELSLVSLVANPATIWMTPWLTLGTLTFLALGLIMKQVVVLEDFGLPLLAWPLSVLCQTFIKTVEFFGQWEWGVLYFPPQPRWFPYIWCLGILSLALVIKRWRSRREVLWYVT